MRSGSNLNILKNKAPFYLEDRDYPAIVIYPQCPSSGSNTSWYAVRSKIKGLIDYSIANYNVDEDKIALTGFSMGGSGVIDLGISYPTLFSCLVPVSGYNNIHVSEYPDCPVWIIGSSADGSQAFSQKIGTLLGNAGKKVKVDIYSKSHVAMLQDTYTSTLINWMIERSRATNSSFKF